MKKKLFLVSLLLGLVVSGMTLVSCGGDDINPSSGSGSSGGNGKAPKGVKAVDLGLPSGTLWANMNVGATTEEGSGYSYAWGETEPQSSRTNIANTYKWWNVGPYNLTKYCTNSEYGYNGFTDNKTELDPEDDAAYMNWGKQWRMPTHEQWIELKSRCFWTLTEINNVECYKVEAPNGNYIFLRSGTYWLRTLSYPPYYALQMSFNRGSVDSYTRGSRDVLHCIRPVRATE